jgi:hypothetical protein
VFNKAIDSLNRELRELKEVKELKWSARAE